MDPLAKKRKSDENGTAAVSPLSPDDAAKILEPFTNEQLLDVVKSALSSSSPSALLDAVRAVADRDPAQRKLFVRGLGWETTNDSLRAVFSPFGDIEEAVVINDKATGRSKGYGFVTFRHIDGALRSLKDPSKKIDGRITVTNLASLGNTGAVPAPATAVPADNSQRKVYVGNVPPDMASDRLLAHFAAYGEIEEGPLGYDKQTGKFRGYALFVYKTVEAARASLVDPTKNIDGHNVICKLANVDSKKKPSGPLTLPNPVGVPQPSVLPGSHPGVPPTPDGPGIGTHPSLPGQFGLPGSGQPFPGYPGLPVPGGLGNHHPLTSTLSSFGSGTPGLLSAVSQAPSSLSGFGAGGQAPSSLSGFGAGGQAPSSLSGFGAGGYGGLGGPYGPSSQYGSQGTGAYAGLGIGSSLYRMPPGSGGMPSGGYPETGHYSLSSAGVQSQHHQPAGSPGRRFPSYPSLPPYF